MKEKKCVSRTTMDIWAISLLLKIKKKIVFLVWIENWFHNTDKTLTSIGFKVCFNWTKTKKFYSC